MSRQDEVREIAELLDKAMVTWSNGSKYELGELFTIHTGLAEIAEHLVDNGIRSAEGFQLCGKKYSDGHGLGIKPIDYSKESK